MKKVKIMLIAITVFAVVGGVLAFKAQKLGIVVFYKTMATDPTCTIPGFTTLQQYPNRGQFYITTQYGNPCNISSSYITDFQH
jgi:hypothetical protein